MKSLVMIPFRNLVKKRSRHDKTLVTNNIGNTSTPIVMTFENLVLQ